MTTQVNRFTYDGFALGGPWKQSRLVSLGDPVYLLVRLKQVSAHGIPDIDFEEIGRGRYEWDSGIWWWKGWE